MKYIVDTNVLIAANGRDTHSDARLNLACARFLMALRDGNDLLLEDSLDLVFREYKGYMQFSGQPGVGDAFFLWYIQSRYVEPRIERVTLDAQQPISHYVPSSLQDFDPSDQKWIAVYLEGGADLIVNATDSDWAESGAELVAEGIHVLELAD